MFASSRSIALLFPVVPPKRYSLAGTDSEVAGVEKVWLVAVSALQE